MFGFVKEAMNDLLGPNICLQQGFVLLSHLHERPLCTGEYTPSLPLCEVGLGINRIPQCTQASVERVGL